MSILCYNCELFRCKWGCLNTDSDTEVEKLICGVLLNIHKYTFCVEHDSKSEVIDFEYRGVVNESS